MGGEEALAPGGRLVGKERRQREGGRVRGDERVGTDDVHQGPEERPLDLPILNNRLEDPVAVCQQ